MSCEKIVSQEINLNTSVNVHLRDSLTLPAPWISESCIEIKINLNFYYTLLCDVCKGFLKTGTGTG